jgi:protein-S-isoprenylcysteine O-methyltransferase Ste14
VEKEQSYIKTTTLVTSGVYSIVRHPQYLSFMLLSLFFMLITQHWIVTALGITAIIMIYTGILPAADQLNIEKFGQDYQRYMQKVPRANFILGMIRLWQRRENP